MKLTKGLIKPTPINIALTVLIGLLLLKAVISPLKELRED